MTGLSDGERMSMIRSAVLIQYTRVTDGRTDRRTDGIGVAYTRYSIMLSRLKTVYPQTTETTIAFPSIEVGPLLRLGSLGSELSQRVGRNHTVFGKFLAKNIAS